MPPSPPPSSRISSAIDTARSSGRHPVLPFICGGHPRSGDTTRSLIALAKVGVPVVEVGIPFSDPIADGPVIAAAMFDAIKGGATPQSVFAEIAAARAQGLGIGVVAMMSISLIHRIGATALINLARASGVDGFIVPDMPIDESAALREQVRAVGLDFISLIAPTSPADRARQIAQSCSGFVYMLARVGITGDAGGKVGGGLDVADVRRRITEVRAVTSVPVVCGFGISTRDDVRAIIDPATGAGADGAIVGSALVKTMSVAAARKEDPAAAAAAFVASLM